MASSIYRKTALLLWADLTDRQGCDIDVDAITEAEIIATWEQILERASSAPAVVQRQFSEAEMREAFEAGCLITNMTKTVAQAEREYAVWMQKRFPKVKVIER